MPETAKRHGIKHHLVLASVEAVFVWCIVQSSSSHGGSSSITLLQTITTIVGIIP